MNVRDLIEMLEELPYNLPIVVNSEEAENVLVRDEIYYSSDYEYKEEKIVKIM